MSWLKSRLEWSREYCRSWVELIDEHLQAFLFLLLCFGLVISSLLMWGGIIESGDWAVVTTGLFGSNAIGGGFNNFVKAKQSKDDGRAGIVK